MSKAKSKSNINNLNKELQKKVDDLSQQLESLKNEHNELKDKYKVLCKKVVDNIDLSEYSFMDPSQVEPDQIDLNDLLHMVQKLALLATQINVEEKMESHIESLELRLTELTNENSSFFKNRLKLQDRLEFIRQERDVWKRNAETLKKMYAKLVKEKESNSSLRSHSTNTRCTIGAYRANIDLKNPSERIYSAPVPRDFYDTVRTNNISTVQLEKIDQNISTQLSGIKQSTPTIDDNKNFFGTGFKLEETGLKNCSPIPNQNLTESYINFCYFDKPKLIDSNMNDQYVPSSAYSLESGCHEPSTGTSTNHNSKKNVSFNKDIDVRIFRKNSKNLTRIVDSFMLPLPQGNADNSQINQDNKDTQAAQETITTLKKNNEDTLSQIDQKNRILFSQTSLKSDSNPLFPFQKQPLSQGTNSFSNSFRTIQSGRGSVCSSRKLPGETPVRDLEPTLKLIIIKELSVEKVDGNDWRMFALRVGMNEKEIKEWISLKLQYPMARVLSFWSSKPEATVRLLHRHLNAPCFNYGSLAKRIENFYDVV